jgi:hypothetical protein
MQFSPSSKLIGIGSIGIGMRVQVGHMQSLAEPPKELLAYGPVLQETAYVIPRPRFGGVRALVRLDKTDPA